MGENMAKAIELEDCELDAVAGGLGQRQNNLPAGFTHMACSKCGYSTDWTGNYSGQTVNCPNCYNDTLTGQ